MLAASRTGLEDARLFYGYLALLTAWGIAADVLCKRLGLRPGAGTANRG